MKHTGSVVMSTWPSVLEPPKNVIAAARASDESTVLTWLDGWTPDALRAFGERARELHPPPYADFNLNFSLGILLMAASSSSLHESLVAQLLLRGADPQQQTPTGMTALMLAASQGCANIVRRLLAAGADRLHRNHEGKDALSITQT